jgi:hypothetical protein
MRIYPSPFVIMVGKKKPHFADGTGMPNRERFRMCEVPQWTRTSSTARFLHSTVLLMPSRPIKFLPPLLHDCYSAKAARWELQGRIHRSN